MSIKLRELIRLVRQCKTAAEERAVIAKESALIRTSFHEAADDGFRHRNVAKLLYIHMMGYPTHFGQLEALKLIASPRFAEKRIGYLGLMILLDEKQEILMLVTNSLKQDFHHINPYVTGLALCSFGNISSADMSRDLSTEIEKLFRNTNPYIRKKAALAAIRCIRKVPELIEDFIAGAISLLNDKTHAVLLCGVTLIIEMIKLDPSTIAQFRKLVPLVVGILKKMVLAGYVSEYDVCGITDPFLQCKIIQLLRILGKGHAESSQEMSDILAQISINTESTKNPGNAILYECVQTIMSIEADGGLRVLAVNILGRFLMNRDNNIRYVALNTLCKVVQSDTKAIQRHRSLVVDCLKDADISIRRRALDLIYALVTKNNVRALVKELLNYLVLASGDKEFKSDLTDKICTVVDRFAPNKRWHIDTLIRVLATAGSYTQQYVSSTLITLIAKAKPLFAYSAHKVYRTLLEMKSLELSLVQVGVWCIGEFGELLVTDKGVEAAVAADAIDRDEKDPVANNFTVVREDDILNLLEAYIRHPNSTLQIRSYVLNTLVKLSTRFTKEQARLAQLIGTYKSSMSVELQQRSCEYSKLIEPSLEKIRRGVLTHMPVVEKKKPASAGAGDESEEESESSEEEEEEETPADTNGATPASAPAPKTAAPAAAPQSKPPAAAFNLLDGLDFLTQGTATNGAPAAAPAAAAARAQPAAVAQAPKPSGLSLEDIFSSSAAPAPAAGAGASASPLDFIMGAAAPPPAAAADADGADSGKLPPMNVLQKDGFKVMFQFKKSSDAKVSVMATFTNSGADKFTNFDFKVAVPKYMKLRMKPASGTEVLPNNANKVTQVFELENTTPGQKKMVVKLKMDFEVNGVPHSEQSQVNNFPGGL